MMLLPLQKQCSQQKSSILIKCLNKETLKTLELTTLNNSSENVSMKNFKNLVTSTSGSTLRLTKSQRKILTGSIILPGGILILIFLLLGRLIIQRLMKVKILKIFGNIYFNK